MRKLLILLLLPIVALTTMGSALMVTADASAVEPTSVVQSIDTPVITQAAPQGDVRSKILIPDYPELTPEQRDAAYASSIYLPTNRWTDMSYHSRVNWWNPVEASNASTARGIAGMLMNGGNVVWKVAADWSRLAMEFKPLESSLGHQIDKISGVLGKAITGQPVLFALIITFLLVVVLFRAMKRPGTRPFGKLLQSALVFGLIMMMGTQAAAGTSGEPSENYKPRAGSPVWIAGAVTGTIDSMAGAAVAGVMDGMLPIIMNADQNTASEKGWSCSAVIQGALNAAASNASPTSGAKAVNLSMNSMWISTAFNTYSVVQFGDSNPFAKEVGCRQLERTTNMASWSRARVLSQSLYGTMYDVNATTPTSNTPFTSMNVPMLQSTGDNEANDAAMVAWAACAPKNKTASGFTVRGQWGALGITEDACKAAFKAGTAAEIKEAGGKVFNIEDTDAVRAKTSDPAIINFISTLHGKDAGAALGTVTSSVVFLIGALVAAGVFGAMSLAVVGSKLFMLLLVAALFVILIVTLFKNESMGETMRQPAFRFLGVTVFAFGATLLLALVATVSLIISSLSSMLGPAGALGPMMWVSFSPLLAVIAAHFLFTKLFKIPSPMTAKGALAWGTAGGAVGAAVGSGVASRLQNRGAAAGRALGRKALASNKYTGWMVGNGKGGADARKGSGDAGSRKAAAGGALGEDLTSQQISERMAGGEDSRSGAGGPSNGAGGVGAGGLGAGALGAAAAAGAAVAAMKGGKVSDERAAAAAAAAQDATKYLSDDRKKEVAREAKKQWRDENPNALRRGIADLKGKLDARNDARAGILANAVAAGDLDEASMLSENARGKVALINRPAMDNFLMAPGEESTVAAIPAAKWADLSPEGKVEASKLAALNARAARETEKVERSRQAKLRREARAAARADLPPLTDRAKLAVKATANSVASTAQQAASAASGATRGAASATTRAANAAWSEAKTKSLEFRADPTGSALGAATSAAVASRKAANATVDAARKASYTAAEGVSKARQTASGAVAATRTDKGRAIAKSAAVVAGGGIALLGSPVVGATMVTVAAARGVGQVRERHAARQQSKQTQLNEIIAARAVARKMPTPRTSIVSDAAPLQAPKSLY